MGRFKTVNGRYLGGYRIAIGDEAIDSERAFHWAARAPGVERVAGWLLLLYGLRLIAP